VPAVLQAVHSAHYLQRLQGLSGKSPEQLLGIPHHTLHFTLQTALGLHDHAYAVAPLRGSSLVQCLQHKLPC
jgi:hypothetical protein